MNAVRVYFPTSVGRDAFLGAVKDAQTGSRDTTLSGFTSTGKLARVEYRPSGDRAVEIEIVRE